MMDKIAQWFTWGRILFLVILGASGFATFVAGEIAGASSLEPRVTALETRTTSIEQRMASHGEVLAEIRGYVRGIAARVGATMEDAP